jgi:hypothetical protein
LITVQTGKGTKMNNLTLGDLMLLSNALVRRYLSYHESQGPQRLHCKELRLKIDAEMLDKHGFDIEKSRRESLETQRKINRYNAIKREQRGAIGDAMLDNALEETLEDFGHGDGTYE